MGERNLDARRRKPLYFEEIIVNRGELNLAMPTKTIYNRSRLLGRIKFVSGGDSIGKTDGSKI